MRFKKYVTAFLLGCILFFGAPMIVQAAVVYYKGTAVYWYYGRNAGVFGFSDCNSQVYEHCSSVNGHSSGWKSEGVLSQAWGFIGKDTLEPYWNCRG